MEIDVYTDKFDYKPLFTANLFYASLRSTVADACANGNKVISAKTTWAGRVTTKAIVSATSWGVNGTKPL